MRKSRGLLPVVLLCLAPAARAVNVKLPVQDASLNLTVTVQTQLLINENGAPNGNDLSYDIYARRTRIQANGEIGFKTWMNGSSALLSSGDMPIRKPSGIATSTASR